MSDYDDGNDDGDDDDCDDDDENDANSCLMMSVTNSFVGNMANFFTSCGSDGDDEEEEEQDDDNDDKGKDDEDEEEEEDDEEVALEPPGLEICLSLGQPAKQCPHSPVPVTWFPPASTLVLHQNLP